MSARIVTDPRLLPYYLTVDQAAAVMQLAARTVHEYCARGDLRRGTHWVKPPHGRRRFLRDALLAWLEEREGATGVGAPIRCRANLVHSPDLAAILEREAV